MDKILDKARRGPIYMFQPRIARLVVEALAHGEEQMRLYDRHAWVVMPNHVHLLITPLTDSSTITHTLKRFTAREANKLLGLQGPFWQAESYDHVVRGGAEFENIARYILMNPVHAGLAATPVEFPWSSAKAD